MSDRRSGYLKIAEINRVPVFIHWSFPIGGLLISLFVGFDLEQAYYYIVGYLILIGIHEFGHVFAARTLGLRVFAVEITGLGGVCRCELPRKPSEALLLYSGGIFGQLLLLSLTVLYIVVFGYPTAVSGRSLINTFSLVNLVVMVANLFPHRESNEIASDGHNIGYAMIYLLRRGNQPFFAPTANSRTFSPDTSLVSLDGFIPDNFTAGIEILNDDKTPMEFVVSALENHINLSREEAVSTMLEIHEKGGVILPLADFCAAQEIVADIAAETLAHGHSLVCRAVGAQQGATADV